MKKFGLFTVLAVLLLFFAVGCAQSVDEEDKVVQVGFSAQYGDDDSSRSLKIDVDTDYKVEDLFWTYKAVKKSGIHTKGQQTSHVSLSAGDTRGLAGYVKEFSTGKWDLEIKGYLDKAHTASKLIYTGTLTNYEISATDTNTVLPFVLNAYPDYGTLKFGTLKIKVPENRTFSANSELVTTINDITSGTAVKIAESTTNVTTAKSPTSDPITLTLSPLTGKDKFVTGAADTTAVHTFQVLIKYKDNSVTGTGDEPDMFSGTFKVVFKKGCTTTISGDFNDYVKTFYPLQTLGGTVFYIRPTTPPTTTAGSKSSVVYGNQYGEVWTNNTLYIFYKADGTPVNLNGKQYSSKYSVIYNEKTGSYNLICEQADDITLLTALKGTATYYTVAQKPASGYKDCVFVGDVLTGLQSKIAWGFDNANSLPTSVSAVPSSWACYGIGKGKTNTNTIKAVTGVRNAGGTIGYNTIFDYLAWMNGETNNNSSVWVAKRSRVPGCTDWYIPSMYEVQVMATCGQFGDYFSTLPTGVTSYRCIICSSVRDQTSGYDCWVNNGTYPSADPVNKRNGTLNRANYYTYVDGAVLVRSF